MSAEVIIAVRAARSFHGIADYNRSVLSHFAERYAKRRGVDMEAVADKFGTNSVCATDIERRTDNTGFSVMKSGLRVEQVCYMANAEFYRVNRLIVTRVRVRD